MSLSGQGNVCCYCKDEQGKPQSKPPDSEAEDEKKCGYSHKFKGMTQLAVLLRKIRYRNKRHIEYYVARQPTNANGKIAENQCTDHRERVRTGKFGLEVENKAGKRLTEFIKRTHWS